MAEEKLLSRITQTRIFRDSSEIEPITFQILVGHSNHNLVLRVLSLPPSKEEEIGPWEGSCSNH